MTIIDTLWETALQRCVLVWDETPLEPEDDGSTPVIEWDIRRGTVKQSGPGTSYRVPSCDLGALLHFLGVDPSAYIWDARERESALGLFARWLHIYRGVTQAPLVAERDGYAYISYVPEDWRQQIGVGEDCKPDMSEWTAYIDGETYGAVLQERVVWTGSNGATRESWESVDSVWGFYGEWAKDGALEHFPNPIRTCRYCGRDIIESDGTWIDPEATGDDVVWRETCDSHDTFAAEHEPADSEQVAS